jgi:putative oxidoreductase
MKALVKFFQLGFLPASAPLALLVLRLWLGLSMLLLHGWGKLTGYAQMAPQFPDPLGIGSHASLALAVLAEALCSTLLVLGLFTRLAALGLVINLGVAFWFVHGHALAGAHSGELAFIYLAGYVVLLLAGGGCCSLDGRPGGKPADASRQRRKE